MPGSGQPTRSHYSLGHISLLDGLSVTGSCLVVYLRFLYSEAIRARGLGVAFCACSTLYCRYGRDT